MTTEPTPITGEELEEMKNRCARCSGLYMRSRIKPEDGEIRWIMIQTSTRHEGYDRQFFLNAHQDLARCIAEIERLQAAAAISEKKVAEAAKKIESLQDAFAVADADARKHKRILKAVIETLRQEGMMYDWFDKFRL